MDQEISHLLSISTRTVTSCPQPDFSGKNNQLLEIQSSYLQESVNLRGELNLLTQQLLESNISNDRKTFLLKKQAKKLDRKVNVLLQQFIAQEETKYGLDKQELIEILEYYRADNDLFSHVHIIGLMGMATFTDNKAQVRAEFKMLKELFDFVKEGYLMPAHFKEVSMGMSGDFETAIAMGATHVRVGTAIFGPREAR